MQRWSRRLLEIGLLLTATFFLSSCTRGLSIAGVSTQSYSPGRFHNTIRVRNASQNLADAVEAKCGANNPKAAAAAGQARAAAQEIDSAIAVFNDTDTSRITNAVADAHKANEAAYNQYLACGGTPPPGVRPGLPGYSETFWDISS